MLLVVQTMCSKRSTRSILVSWSKQHWHIPAPLLGLSPVPTLATRAALQGLCLTIVIAEHIIPQLRAVSFCGGDGRPEDARTTFSAAQSSTVNAAAMRTRQACHAMFMQKWRVIGGSRFHSFLLCKLQTRQWTCGASQLHHVPGPRTFTRLSSSWCSVVQFVPFSLVFYRLVPYSTVLYHIVLYCAVKCT